MAGKILARSRHTASLCQPSATMALRRGVTALLPRVLATSSEAGRICCSSQPVLGFGGFSSSDDKAGSTWGPTRSFASELAAIKSGGTTACDKLSMSPTSHIVYDESNHKRYAPGAVEKSPAVMVQAAGRFFYATAARLAALKFILSMSAAADVLALASLEVDMSAIEEGQTVTVKWRGKPVFIRYRTPEEIAEANDIDMAQLRDPQTDTERVVDPKYLVVVGVCTHLGCVPISGAGDYNGWFCPCHGSHYDISGRIRKGPAPYNLEVPEYRFIEGGSKAIIG